jgi:hypothetical protein
MLTVIDTLLSVTFYTASSEIWLVVVGFFRSRARDGLGLKHWRPDDVAQQLDSASRHERSVRVFVTAPVGSGALGENEERWRRTVRGSSVRTCSRIFGLR